MSYPISSLALRQARVLKRNQNSVKYPTQERRLGPVTNTLLLGLILVVIGLLYLTQITKTSAYGFEIGELKEQKNELVKENQTLEVETARLQALERVRTSEVAKNLEDATQVEFAQSR